MDPNICISSVNVLSCSFWGGDACSSNNFTISIACRKFESISPIAELSVISFLLAHHFFETVARAPGCSQKTFSVQCGAEPWSQEGNTMFGPGEYRPDPSAGITAPADLPQPEIVPYSRNDI